MGCRRDARWLQERVGGQPLRPPHQAKRFLFSFPYFGFTKRTGTLIPTMSASLNCIGTRFLTSLQETYTLPHHLYFFFMDGTVQRKEHASSPTRTNSKA